jgi:hypothetical protein
MKRSGSRIGGGTSQLLGLKKENIDIPLRTKSLADGADIDDDYQFETSPKEQAEAVTGENEEN